MKWRRRVVGYLAGILVLYLIYCGLLFFFQTALIFPADFAGASGDELPTAETERIELETDQGTTVAWFVPARGSGVGVDEAKPLAVFFHGNAELIDHQRSIIDLYHRWGVSVLLVEYRGYGHSDGTPSQQHIVADTLAVLDDVLGLDEVAGDKLILHGRSIGGGLAAQVALQTEPAAVVVESTGASVAGMAWRYGVPPFLVRSPLRTAEAFEQLDTPILILHGEHDAIFPIADAHRLEQAGSDATLVVFDADHNTLPGATEAALYEQSIEQHLRDAGVLR